MAKYRELPAKPKSIEAIQFTGIDKGVPTFNEPIPTWLLANMIAGRLAMLSSTLAFDDVSVPVGSWFFVDEGDSTGETLRFAPATMFLATFKPVRKKPVRKPKVQGKTAAATAMAAE